MNTVQKLRALADSMGLDGYAESLREIAADLEKQQAAPAQEVGLTDEEIQTVVTQAARDGKVSWLGFKQDAEGAYTIPVLSKSDYQFARAIIAALRAKGQS